MSQASPNPVQGLIYKDDYIVILEIWAELPSRDDKGKFQFLDMGIPDLCTLECAVGKVYWVLDSVLLPNECRIDCRRGDS